ncbi:peptidoglycan DD-metalloendopeptidase family protein [Leptolyngbya sp. NIES-2104]|uniref:peptidoglycan DD-metalloendopeptidase family protein n=1 Tax=Leptolyngbya sp. NIES-2104 TaxID=1552121 RepID=UPI0006EC478C|nr:M23 family metallopeptidase [Leptolyngbya sp. NIES-2104]GAP99171.1 peptidase M23B [Leptolyngbya sp. NIES-2104]
MKINRTGRILAQSLALFVLSFGILTAPNWLQSSFAQSVVNSATQPAELIANQRFAQINVQVEPSANSTIAGFAYSGDRIRVLSQTQTRDGSTWYKMESNRSGIIGWVQSNQVRLLAASAPKVITIRSTPAPDPLLLPASNCAPVYPVPIPVINQGFGRVSDPFNPGQTHFHTGVDFDGKVGDPINSPICGVVSYVGREQDTNSYEWGYGWHVKVRDSQGQIHLFAHISKAYVKPGQTITPGQLIAAIGNNGNSTGPHLHYEIRQGVDTYQSAIDPMQLLDRAGQGGVRQAGVESPSTTPLRF